MAIDHHAPHDKVSATLVRRQSYVPWWTGLLKPVDALVGMLPSYRDTKSGRTHATQIRVALLASGMAVVIFGGSIWLIIMGAIAMISATILPLTEVAKGGLRGRIRRAGRRRMRPSRSPGAVVWDGKRLILMEVDADGDLAKVRRVLVDRGQHSVELGRRGADICMGIRPASGRKAESIWVCGPVADDLPDGMSDALAAADTPIEADVADIWANVDPEGFETIYCLLHP